MKKLLVLLFASVLACSLVFTLSGCSTQVGTLRDEVAKIKNYQNTYEKDGLVYIEINDGAEYSLVDYSDDTLTSVTVPSSVNGKNVTSIGPYAFFDLELRTLRFAANSNLKTIEKFAFYKIATLRTAITIPATVEEIQLCAFAETRIQVIEFEEGSALQTIGDRAFSSCKGLYEAYLPEGLKTIGKYAFETCDAMEIIIIPSSVESVGEWCFYSCDTLINNSIHLVDGAFKLYTKNANQDEDPNTDDEFIVTDTVYHNGAVVFDNAYYLGNDQNPTLVLIEAISKDIKTCTISENTKIIAGPSFYACKSLEAIEIPASVEAIGAYAFCECDILKTVTLAENAKLSSVGSYAFYKCDAIETNETEGVQK